MAVLGIMVLSPLTIEGRVDAKLEFGEFLSLEGGGIMIKEFRVDHFSKYGERKLKKVNQTLRKKRGDWFLPVFWLPSTKLPLTSLGHDTNSANSTYAFFTTWYFKLLHLCYLFHVLGVLNKNSKYCSIYFHNPYRIPLNGKCVRYWNLENLFVSLCYSLKHQLKGDRGGCNFWMVDKYDFVKMFVFSTLAA